MQSCNLRVLFFQLSLILLFIQYLNTYNTESNVLNQLNYVSSELFGYWFIACKETFIKTRFGEVIAGFHRVSNTYPNNILRIRFILFIELVLIRFRVAKCLRNV